MKILAPAETATEF